MANNKKSSNSLRTVFSLIPGVIKIRLTIREDELIIFCFIHVLLLMAFYMFGYLVTILDPSLLSSMQLVVQSKSQTGQCNFILKQVGNSIPITRLCCITWVPPLLLLLVQYVIMALLALLSSFLMHFNNHYKSWNSFFFRCLQ